MSNKNKAQDAKAEEPKLITLESNVGKAHFALSFTSLNLDAITADAPTFIGYHLWHKVQGQIFAGGKKAKFVKKSKTSEGSPYSPEFAAHALKCAQDELGKYCNGLTIEVSEELIESEYDKFAKVGKQLGWTPEQTKAAWDTAQANKPASAPAVEEKTLE